MHNYRTLFLCLFFNLLFIFCCLLITSAQNESLTISTYYPSPSGSYKELQLFPHSTPTSACNSNTRGTLYYDSDDDQIYVCGSSNWGVAGLWSLNGTNISNTNSGSVQIGATDATLAKYSSPSSYAYLFVGPDPTHTPQRRYGIVGHGWDGGILGESESTSVSGAWQNPGIVYGVLGYNYDAPPPSHSIYAGVYGEDRIGIWTGAGDGFHESFGVYGVAPTAGVKGVGTSYLGGGTGVWGEGGWADFYSPNNTYKIGSSRKFKKDISYFSDKDYKGILDKVSKLRVAKYRYKNQTGSDKRIGIIAEEAPAEIVDKNREFANIGDEVGFLFAAVKALREENLALKKEIGQLKKTLKK